MPILKKKKNPVIPATAPIASRATNPNLGLPAGSLPITSTLPPGSTLQQNPNRNQEIADRTQEQVMKRHGQAMWEMNPNKRGRVQDRIDARVARRIANLEGPGSQIIPPTIVPPGGGDPKVDPPFIPTPDPGPPPFMPTPDPGPGDFPDIPGLPPYTPIPPDGGIDPVIRPGNRQEFANRFGIPNSLKPGNFDPRRGAPDKRAVEVGRDPLSRLISGAFDQLIGSGGAPQSDLGVASDQSLFNFLSNPPRPPELTSPDPTQLEQTTSDALVQLLQSGGSFDEDTVNARAESARENLERFRRAEEQTLGSRLADRGMIGSGIERTGLENLSGNIAGQFATTLRDIISDQEAAASNRFSQALAAGTAGSTAQRQEALQRQALGEQQGARFSADQLRALGLSQAATQGAADTLIQAVDLANRRQDTLSRLALANLQQSTDFNRFLATFGLQRDQVMEDIQNGRINQLMPLLDSFFQGASMAQRGTV